MDWMGVLEWFGARPSMDTLARRMLARLSADQPGEWRWDADAGALVHASGALSNLGNVHLEYSGAPRRVRAALLDKYVASARTLGREPPKLWSVAAKQLFVVLRSRYDLDLARLMLEKSDDAASASVVQRPLLDDLQVRLVYDFGPSVSTVPRSVTDVWGQSDDALFAQGLANLAALQPTPVWEDLGEGVFSLSSEASYAESFVLVPKVVDRLPFAAHAALSPCNRGVLLAADARDERALGQMLDLALAAQQQQPWPMSSTVLVRDGSGWARLVRDGVVGRKLREMDRMAQAALYRDQKAELERVHERDGVDVFVATVSLMRRSDDGPLESWCTWTRTVDTLLPQTDVVALLRDVDAKQPRPVLVPWDVVAEVCAPWMEATPHVPVRWRVRGFPDDAAWGVLVGRGVKSLVK
jgi:hypothetical protein